VDIQIIFDIEQLKMDFLKKLFQRNDNKQLGDVVELRSIEKESSTIVGLPTAHPLPDNWSKTFTDFLNKCPQVSVAYLVQINYLNNPKMAPSDFPCLTLCIDMVGSFDKSVFSEISTNSQKLVDGQLDGWQFLDILPVSDEMRESFSDRIFPFYILNR